MNFIFIQIIGLLGLLFVIISFQKDKKSFTLGVLLLAALFFTTHFLLLGAWTGAAMNGISAVRAYVFNLRDRKTWLNNRITMYLFILFFWIAGLLTWQGYVSLLPVIGMTLECLSLWSKKTRHMRWLFLACTPFWLVYNYMVDSYAGIATEIFIISSLLVAIIRFDIKWISVRKFIGR
jgi:hypothetical protein